MPLSYASGLVCCAVTITFVCDGAVSGCGPPRGTAHSHTMLGRRGLFAAELPEGREPSARNCRETFRVSQPTVRQLWNDDRRARHYLSSKHSYVICEKATTWRTTSKALRSHED